MKEDSDTIIIELKAKAYDAFAQIEYWQGQLVEINKSIAIEMRKVEKKTKD